MKRKQKAPLTRTTKYIAHGGKVRGRGGPRSDSVPAWLSPGEWVAPADTTRQLLPLLETLRGITHRYQDGGLVERARRALAHRAERIEQAVNGPATLAPSAEVPPAVLPNESDYNSPERIRARERLKAMGVPGYQDGGAVERPGVPFTEASGLLPRWGQARPAGYAEGGRVVETNMPGPLGWLANKMMGGLYGQALSKSTGEPAPTYVPTPQPPSQKPFTVGGEPALPDEELRARIEARRARGYQDGGLIGRAKQAYLNRAERIEQAVNGPAAARGPAPILPMPSAADPDYNSPERIKARERLKALGVPGYQDGGYVRHFQHGGFNPAEVWEALRAANTAGPWKAAVPSVEAGYRGPGQGFGGEPGRLTPEVSRVKTYSEAKARARAHPQHTLEVDVKGRPVVAAEAPYPQAAASKGAASRALGALGRIARVGSGPVGQVIGGLLYPTRTAGPEVDMNTQGPYFKGISLLPEGSLRAASIGNPELAMAERAAASRRVPTQYEIKDIPRAGPAGAVRTGEPGGALLPNPLYMITDESGPSGGARRVSFTNNPQEIEAARKRGLFVAQGSPYEASASAQDRLAREPEYNRVENIRALADRMEQERVAREALMREDPVRVLGESGGYGLLDTARMQERNREIELSGMTPKARRGALELWKNQDEAALERSRMGQESEQARQMLAQKRLEGAAEQDLERRQLAFEQERLLPEIQRAREVLPLDVEARQLELRGARQRQALIDTVYDPKATPGAKEQAGQLLRALAGKGEAARADYSNVAEAALERFTDPTTGVFDQKGYFDFLAKLQGGGASAPTFAEYAARVRSDPRNKGVTDEDLMQGYRARFGGG